MKQTQAEDTTDLTVTVEWTASLREQEELKMIRMD